MIDRRALLGTGGTAALSALIGYPGYVWGQARKGALNAMMNGEPPTLNYPLANIRQVQQVCGSINESLLLFDWKLNPQPNLAKSFELSPDGLVYTFHLQEGVQWHDGHPFTAKDVVFSSDVMLRELNARSRAAMGRCESIKALDDHTVEYRLKEPFNAFLLAFMASTGPMMPAHIYEGTNFRTNPANDKPVGTGPFKFQQWARGQFIHLVRNEAYWRKERPFLDEIFFRLVPAAEQRVVAIQTGAVDIAMGDDIDPVAVPSLRQQANLEFIANAYDGTGEITVMEINQRREPFSDQRFRAAIMHALNRQFLVDAVNFGLGKVANSPIPSSMPYYDDKAVVKYPHDPARAKQLLDEMGLKPQAGGIRARFSMMMLPVTDGPWIRAAQYAKQALAEIGLEVELQSSDNASFMRRNGDWDFDLMWNSYGQYGDPAIGTSRFFLSSNIRKGAPQTNVQGYVNKRIDELFDLGARALTREDAQRHYSELQRILTQDVAMLWMFERQPPLFVNRKFRNTVMGPNGPCDGFGEAYIG